tara:strand:+ start:1007 stop:1558 length:552 start_codon:yes stop_codon:yes gene_type:complete
MNKEQPIDKSNYGMTLVEVMFAVSVFTAFVAVFLATFSFVQKFLKGTEELNLSSNGLLVDHQYLYKEMDLIAEIISQPAFTVNNIHTMTKECTRSPTIDWGLPGKNIKIPNGYSLCLKKTSFSEPDDSLDGNGNILKTSLKKLLDREAKEPGIYVLLALPEEISASSISVRRIFCRPLPFCGH